MFECSKIFLNKCRCHSNKQNVNNVKGFSISNAKQVECIRRTLAHIMMFRKLVHLPNCTHCFM